jgi:uncharacterized FlgJ-related protein
MFGFNKKVAKSSPLSDFVRGSTSGERKKIYAGAIQSAIESQNSVIAKAKQIA